MSYQWIKATINTADEQQYAHSEQPHCRAGPVPAAPSKDFGEEHVILLLQSGVKAKGSDGNDNPDDEEGRGSNG